MFLYYHNFLALSLSRKSLSFHSFHITCKSSTLNFYTVFSDLCGFFLLPFLCFNQNIDKIHSKCLLILCFMLLHTIIVQSKQTCLKQTYSNLDLFRFIWALSVNLGLGGSGGGRYFLPTLWFSLNNSETVKALTLDFCSN